jgi:hypothetical protein
MIFDIHQLDIMDSYDSEAEEAFDKYQDALLELFANSPEGQARLEVDPEMGFWAAQFMHFGYNYIGVTLPQMATGDVNEIVTELFPRKVSILSPDDADDTIPELIAFWQYLKREYELPNADSILRFLRKVAPDFTGIMNDPSRFGMAKSFLALGRSAGFDMTDEEEINKFFQLYNAGIVAQDPEIESLLATDGLPDFAPGIPSASVAKKAKARKRKSRKMAKTSRRRNRRKRR